MRNRSHFQRGSGVFTCAECGRRTRVVDQGNDSICSECWELAGLDNSVNDKAQSLAEVVSERDAIAAIIVKRGGNIDKVMRSNSFLWPKE